MIELPPVIDFIIMLLTMGIVFFAILIAFLLTQK